jgi:hypothetical protein
MIAHPKQDQALDNRLGRIFFAINRPDSRLPRRMSGRIWKGEERICWRFLYKCPRLGKKNGQFIGGSRRFSAVEGVLGS